MKLLNIISLIFAALVFAGCASTQSTTVTEEVGPVMETRTDSSNTGGTEAKTAYDGDTGSGLLMERYKSGRIEGFRD